MSTDLNKLLEETVGESEREGLNQMIQRMLTLKQMTRMRESEDKVRGKEIDVSSVLAEIDKENKFPKEKSRGRKGARNINK